MDPTCQCILAIGCIVLLALRAVTSFIKVLITDPEPTDLRIEQRFRVPQDAVIEAVKQGIEAGAKLATEAAVDRAVEMAKETAREMASQIPRAKAPLEKPARSKTSTDNTSLRRCGSVKR